MTLPAGFRAWTITRGCGPHWETWTPNDLAAFLRWKLDWFIDKQRARKADGTTRLMSTELIRARVREDLDRLAAPPPSRPWLRCDCHVFRPRRTAVAEPEHGLIFIESFRRALGEPDP